MKTKILSLHLLLCTAAMSVDAQTALNAAGGSAVIGSTQLDWSVAEMALTSTFSSPAIIVTQGVLQPWAGTTGVAGAGKGAQRMQVFPNPASSWVNIKYTSIAGANIVYNLFDAGGKSVVSGQLNVGTGISQQQLDVAKLASADYLLEIIVTENNAAAEKVAYKIQKLN